jgi:hypothetical protein
MRVPQVSERLKEVPAQALRGVFAGIGQLLLITDKLRNKAPAGTDVPRTRTPEPAETVPQGIVADTATDSVPAAREAPEPVATGTPETTETAKTTETSETPQGSATAGTAKTPAAPKARDFDKTGNVRLLGGEDAAAHAARKTAKQPGKAAGTSKGAEASSPADTSPAAEASPVAEAAEEPGDAGPPLPNYDELTVPSLRARLRNLDITQVRKVLEYERAHAARPEVITMFERRIAKLAAEA